MTKQDTTSIDEKIDGILYELTGSTSYGNFAVKHAKQTINALIATQIQEAYDRGYADACLRHNWLGEDNE